jgi:hypothetical protein
LHYLFIRRNLASLHKHAVTFLQHATMDLIA